MVGERRPIAQLPLDPNSLILTKDDLKFFRLWTGITNEEELREHIVDVAVRAYKAYNYACFPMFSFTKPRIFRTPIYDHILQLCQKRPGAIFLDVGCCVGQELRKAVADGWPAENAIGFDLEPAFWEYGHRLFKTNPESFKASFIAGDVFDPKMIKPRDPFYEPPSTPRPQNLQLLNSLAPVQGHVSVIYASLFFHLFYEDDQITLAKRLASLLSPEPGSVICGWQVGAPVKTTRTHAVDYLIVCHSPESWRELWDGRVFEKGTVRVDAVMTELKGNVQHVGTLPMLEWSITRL